jgi:hypothetical protein
MSLKSFPSLILGVTVGVLAVLGTPVCVAQQSSIQSPEEMHQAAVQCPPIPRCEQQVLSCEQIVQAAANCPDVFKWCVVGPNGRMLASYSKRADAESCVAMANEQDANGDMAWASGPAACGVEAYNCSSTKPSDQYLRVRVEPCLAPVGTYCKSGCVRFNSSECFQGCTSFLDKPHTWNNSGSFGRCSGGESARFYTNNSKKRCAAMIPPQAADCSAGFGPTPR